MTDEDGLAHQARVLRRVQCLHHADGLVDVRLADGLNGLTVLPVLGLAQRPSWQVLPWKTLSASISRPSVARSSPCALAIGVAVSCARSSGEPDMGDVAGEMLGDPVGHLAARARRGGSRGRPYRIPSGLATSPYRIRWTTVMSPLAEVLTRSPPLPLGPPPEGRRSAEARSSWAVDTNQDSKDGRRW